MNEQEELGWDAIRYVMAELDEAERQRFERRLAEDQSAREAVAEAVELRRSIVAVESRPDHGMPRAVELGQDAPVAWRAGAVWAVLGTAICIALAVAIARLPRPEHVLTRSVPPRAFAATTGELAILWSQTHDALDGPLWPPEQLDVLADDTLAAETELGITDFRADADDEPDSWIREAVFGLVQQSGDDEDSSMEEL